MTARMNRAAVPLLLSAGSFSLLAQTTPEATPVPTDITSQVSSTLVDLAIRYPWIALVISLMGVLRLALKPVMMLLHARAAATPEPDDDRLLDQVERSIAFQAFAFALDWFGSIKLPARSTKPSDSTGGTAILLALLLPAFLLQPGCTTTGGAGSSDNQVITPQRVEKITRLAVWTTTTAWTTRQPDSVPKFQAALRGVDALVLEQNWDVTALASALTSSGSDSFTGSEGRLIISGTTLLIDTIAGDRVDVRKYEYAQAVILGAQAGLRLGLGLPSTDH